MMSMLFACRLVDGRTASFDLIPAKLKAQVAEIVIGYCGLPELGPVEFGGKINKIWWTRPRTGPLLLLISERLLPTRKVSEKRLHFRHRTKQDAKKRFNRSAKALREKCSMLHFLESPTGKKF